MDIFSVSSIFILTTVFSHLIFQKNLFIDIVEIVDRIHLFLFILKMDEQLEIT
jgi:hypothetical protein